MFGIVIWYDNDSRMGVVWCEDQKNLAVIDANSLDLENADFLVPGDQFTFRENWNSGVRHVTEIEELFSPQHGQDAVDLANLLKTLHSRNGKPQAE